MTSILLLVSVFGFCALATAQQQLPGVPLAGSAPETRSYMGTYNARPSYVNVQVAPNPAYVEGQAQGLSAVDASRQLIAAAVAQGANPNNFGVQTGAHYNIAQAPNPQNPPVSDALDALRGRASLTIDEIMNILAVAVAGKDYPIYNDIPSTHFSCENVHQAGFYADAEAQCQVIRRCDINGVEWSYLCPNMTLFNQITLVCDWFFNVNCNNAVQYYDYSNPRLYTNFALLDTPQSAVVVTNNFGVAAPVRPVYSAPVYSAAAYSAPALAPQRAY